jgi:hypothetical protein
MMKRLLLAGLLAVPAAKSHGRSLRAEAGKLSLKRGTAWSDSDLLRLLTEEEYASCAVRLRLFVAGFKVMSPEDERPWDGARLLLRHRSAESHYEAAVARRDGAITIKKMAPGPQGPALYTLAQGYSQAPLGSWMDVRAAVTDEPDGRVRITLHVDGALIVEAFDDGSLGGPPITGSGRAGLSADNAEVSLVDFRLDALPEAAAPAVAGGSVTVRGSDGVVTWRTAGESDSVVEYGPTPDLGLRAAGSFGREHAVTLPGLEPGAVYHYRVLSRGASGASAGAPAKFTAKPEVDVVGPVPVITSPSEGGRASGAVTVSASATDDTGVAGMQFFLDGQALAAEQPGQPYSLSFDTSRFPDGEHTLTAVARDAAGNRGTAAVVLTISNAASAQSGDAVQYAFTAPSAAAGLSAAAAAGEGAGPEVVTASADPARAPQRFLTPSLPDGINDAALFGADASEVSVYDLRGRRVFHAMRRGGPTLSWNGRDGVGRIVESGVYVARIVTADGRSVLQSFAVAK